MMEMIRGIDKNSPSLEGRRLSFSNVVDLQSQKKSSNRHIHETIDQFVTSDRIESSLMNNHQD
jgi:hypothetical protein